MGPQTDVRPDHPGGVDLYVGGVEHAVLHLLYSRFWHKVLFDLGYLSSAEPYSRLFNQGYIQAAGLPRRTRASTSSRRRSSRRATAPYTSEGQPVTKSWGRMGKSLKNGVAPETIYEAYGADTLRLHLMASGPLDASRPWETRDVVGMFRFLQRVWRNIVDEQTGALPGRRRAGRRRDPSAAAPHDRHRARRHGAPALQHGDRQADRAQQPRHQAARPRPARWPSRSCSCWRRSPRTSARSCGAGSVTRGTIAYVALPERRRRSARRRVDRVPRAGERQGADPHHGAGRRRRGRRGRRRPGRRQGRSSILDGAEPKKVIVVPGRMVNIVA